MILQYQELQVIYSSQSNLYALLHSPLKTHLGLSKSLFFRGWWVNDLEVVVSISYGKIMISKNSLSGIKVHMKKIQYWNSYWIVMNIHDANLLLDSYEYSWYTLWFRLCKKYMYFQNDKWSHLDHSVEYILNQ